VNLAELYLEFGDWKFVRGKVIAENLLQTRTLSTAKRISREVVSRLETLSAIELELLAEGSHQDQTHLLWIAVCRRYRFIAELAVEVLRDRYISLKSDISHEDFDSFFNRKSEWSRELDEISQSTRKKLRQVLFRILYEADLISQNNMINAVMLSPTLVEVISTGDRRDVLYFPISESDLTGMEL